MKKQLLVLISVVLMLGCHKDNMKSAATTNGQGGSMARFTIVNNFLYTVDKENLKVFNISDPSHPVFVRNVPVGFEIETIFPFKDKLFIGSTSAVHIFEITDPANPVKLSVAISPAVMRRCDPVVAKDTVAYATLRTNAECGGIQSILAVYDIRDVTNPKQVTAYSLSEPYGLGYSGNTLYVCDQTQGLIVFDISTAFQPQFVRQLTVPNAGHFIDVIPYQNLLVCWTSKGMVLYDISSPQDPQLLTQIF